MQIILVNGLSQVGKDTFCEAIKREYPKLVIHEKLSIPLKYTGFALHALRGDERLSGWDEYEEEKDQKNSELLLKLSWREMQKILFRNFSAIFGDSFLVDLLVRRLTYTNKNTIVLISDCGRKKELEYLMLAFGHKKLSIVNIRRDIHIKEETEDYREDLVPQSELLPLSKQVALINNGSLLQLEAYARYLFTRYLTNNNEFNDENKLLLLETIKSVG